MRSVMLSLLSSAGAAVRGTRHARHFYTNTIEIDEWYVDPQDTNSWISHVQNSAFYTTVLQ